MTEIKLNAFGGLTGLNNFKFNDIDLNFDKKISQEELEAFKDYYGIDSLEFANMDINDNGKILQSEFTIANVKAELQSILDECAEEILAQVPEEYREEFAADIVAFAQDFFNNSGLTMAEMRAQFRTALNDKVSELKAGIAEKEFNKKFDEAAELAFNLMENVLIEKGLTSLEDRQRFASKYFAIVRFDQGLKEASLNLTVDQLANTIYEKLFKTDKSVLSDTIQAAYQVGESVGNVVDTNEAQLFKSAVYNILEQAIANGITLTLNGVKITSDEIARQFLSNFNFYDIGKYNRLIQEIDMQVSEETLLDKLLAQFRAEEQEDKINNTREKISDFGSLDFDETGLSSIKNYGGTIDVREGNIFLSLDRILDEGKTNAQNVLQELMQPLIINAVKARCEALGIEFTSDMMPIIASVLGDAIAQAVENNCYLEPVFLTKKACLNVGPAVDQAFAIFNENFANIMNERLNNNELIKDAAVTDGKVVDNSTVNVTVGQGINVNSSRNDGEAYTSRPKNQNFTLADLLNGSRTSTIALSDFAAGGNNLSAEKQFALSNIKALINDLGKALINGGYNADRVNAAVDTCISFYSAVINAMEEPVGDKSRTTRYTTDISYYKNGESVSEDVSYYGDHHDFDDRRVGMESSSTNSTGLQVYRDNSGQDDYFITVDLAKVVQTLYRFL